MHAQRSIIALALALGVAPTTIHAKDKAPPRLATLPIPGEPAFVEVARRVLDQFFAMDPSFASGAGLFDDALRVPHFGPASVKRHIAQLDKDLVRLRAMPWRSWPVDRQIDFRWIFAVAETLRHELAVERRFVHRPAMWLEPLANNLIAFASYRPHDRRRVGRIWKQVPAMLREMRAVVTKLTRRDQDTALEILAALMDMAQHELAASAQPALRALRRYQSFMKKQKAPQAYRVVGAEAYRWRLRHSLLLPYSDVELLKLAQQELSRVDEQRARIKSKIVAVTLSDAQKKRARLLDRKSLLAMYDRIEVDLLASTRQAGFVSIPPAVGPIVTRETPAAMVPLTGDGGSMNPPPTYVDDTSAYWNVEHFHDDWSLDRRLEAIDDGENWRRNGMGPYAAHEGWPGHHLQLSIARLNPNLLRSILPDPVQNEGWALYAEEELWRHGGFGDSAAAQDAMLRSYRYRIARVVYDVNIETGVWTLQQGADFKHRAKAGEGKVDEDVRRSIQWPTQLICYFSGKRQILELREAYRAKMGTRYSDRAFHDALLAEGSIPVALIRAKLLEEPVPGID